MRFLARISVRLLLFNVLLVFLPAAGFFYLEVYEKELLEAQERAMVQQGRVAAAALAGQGELDAASARALLRRLEGRTESRLRIVDRQGNLLADSARLCRPARLLRRQSAAMTSTPPPIRSLEQPGRIRSTSSAPGSIGWWGGSASPSPRPSRPGTRRGSTPPAAPSSVPRCGPRSQAGMEPPPAPPPASAR